MERPLDRQGRTLTAGNAVEKIKNWVNQGAKICYLTSHENSAGVEIDHLPDSLEKLSLN